MLLEDLSEYAAAQNERIAKLPSTAISPASSIWEELRSSHWGKPLTSFEKEEPLEYDPDPAPSLTPPANRSILTVAQEQLNEWQINVPGGKLLVRSEYHETEQAVLFGSGDHTLNVFLVTGHPGIGSFTPLPTVYGLTSYQGNLHSCYGFSFVVSRTSSQQYCRSAKTK